jgi:hypothetical protein
MDAEQERGELRQEPGARAIGVKGARLLKTRGGRASGEEKWEEQRMSSALENRDNNGWKMAKKNPSGG